MDYISQNHSKYLIMVHLIFVCKYRKKLLIEFGDEMKSILYQIAQEKRILVLSRWRLTKIMYIC